MASQKEYANVAFAMLGIGALGLLAATLGKGGGRVGEVVAEGEAEGADGNAYEWRVETMAKDESGNTHVGKARLPGFGMWDNPEVIVAMGPSENATKGLVLEYLATLA